MSELHQPPFLVPKVPSELHLRAILAARDDAHAAPDAGLSRSLRVWLRAEGLATGIGGMTLYGWLDGPWLALFPLLLLPDLSLVGYLRGPRLGAALYRLVHNGTLGLGLLGLGLAGGAPTIGIAGVILITHIGLERALGHGLETASSSSGRA